jgi:lactoylglutathione lyase
MKFLHTMLRVSDIEASLAFYTGALGMSLLRQQDNKEYRYTLAFVGYQPEDKGTVLELTYNWDTSKYTLGDSYGHIAIGVDDIYQTCEVLSQQGINIIRAPGPVKGGSSIIAFIQDPDGYKIELIEKND